MSEIKSPRKPRIKSTPFSLKSALERIKSPEVKSYALTANAEDLRLYDATVAFLMQSRPGWEKKDASAFLFGLLAEPLRKDPLAREAMQKANGEDPAKTTPAAVPTPLAVKPPEMSAPRPQ
jgi:hypothetical protein